MITEPIFPLTLAELCAAYCAHRYKPADVIRALYADMGEGQGGEIWIHLRPLEAVLAEAEALAASGNATLPLFGIPFAVKDNIEVAGMPCTVGCPAYQYTPEKNATVVQRLLAAGALLIGKTNLDQFATGLVGTRSPYGAVRNPFNPAYISGGSSSGSAASVARGWVAFSLGTDTAGSGRVPAGACNLVGLKPTPGLFSTAGVVPACRSLDCVSVFAHTVEDAWAVANVLAGKDSDDIYSRAVPALGVTRRKIRLGIPATPEFFGDVIAEKAWSAAIAEVRADPRVELLPLDFAPFYNVARLLYEGPWVAERRAAIAPFMDLHAEDMDPTVRGIIAGADAITAVDTFNGIYRLEALRPACDRILETVDMLMVPTAPSIYTHAEIAADPVVLNSRLGTYTNFVNLLGMAALAMPGPFRDDGLPASVTLLGAAGSDHRLADFAVTLQPRLHTRLGCTSRVPAVSAPTLAPLPFSEPVVEIAVVGAHLTGLPLNWQLVERGARLLQTTHTAPHYRLYALSATTPAKPGLIRTRGPGAAIEVEVWQIPTRVLGSFVADIPPPLGIGSLELADGRVVKGFICEPWVIDDAIEITSYGGWRAYLAAQG
jgi:allophanate hydrolase